jgi:hypothetical protein
MAERGGQPGNQNAAKSKLVADAMRKAAAQEDYARLRQGVEKVWDAFASGEQWAAGFVRDTFDGKPAQAVTVGNAEGESFVIEKLVREIVRPPNSDG